MESSHFLLRHGDKLVVGAFAAWLGFAVVQSLALPPPGIQQGEAFAKAAGNLEQEVANVDFQLPAAPRDMTATVSRELDPTQIAAVGTFPHWLCHHRPSFIFDTPREEPLPVPVHMAALIKMTKVERHRVVLAWAPDERNLHVRVTGYELFRLDSPTAKPVSLAKLGPEAREFTDEGVGARMTVAYRIVERVELTAEEPELQKKNVVLKDELVAVTSELPTFVTPRDHYVEVISGEPENAITLAKPHARLRVHCFTPAGKLYSKDYEVALEEKIGKLETAFKVDNKHTERVDFSSGAKLCDVVKVREKITGSDSERDRIVVTVEWPWGEKEQLKEHETPAEVKAPPKTN